MEISFSEHEKATMFDELSKLFYGHNFGQASKADIELLMFRFYLEKVIASCVKDDGTVDYNLCSDYRISKALGITQQRVRTLKVKKQLVYAADFDWQRALGGLIQNARYDQVSKKIAVGIPDPNLYLEIENYIEEQGGYIEKQRNSKMLQMRAEYFIALATSLEPEEKKKAVVKALKKALKEAGQDDTLFDNTNIGKSLLEAGVNITSIVSDISSLISSGNAIGQALKTLILK